MSEEICSMSSDSPCGLQFTNIGKDFLGTLDYILYTDNSLVPTAMLELPEESEVKPRANSGLPNETWSSDHIALLAEFAYRPQVPLLCLPLLAIRRPFVVSFT